MDIPITAGDGSDHSIDPIAVIGFAFKFPQASSSEALWDLLINGRSARTEVPADRYNADSFYREGVDRNKTGTVGYSNTNVFVFRWLLETVS